MPLNIEEKINETIIQVLSNYDIKMFESVLSEDLVFETFLSALTNMNKEECIGYFTEEFKHSAEGSGYNLSIKDYNGHKRVVINSSILPVVLDTEIEDDKVIRLSLNPFPSFSPRCFGIHFSYIFDSALRYLNKYFKDLCPNEFRWLQTFPHEIRFQDLCLAYKTHVLSITVGLYLPDGKDGKKYFTNEQQLKNMLRESKENHLTPCLFLLDPDGRRHFDGPNLVDPTTLEPIDLDNITDGSNGIMSPWEIRNLGISHACDYIYNLGCTDIKYCDVPNIEPQLYFTYKGESCFALVRTVLCGDIDKKFVINKNMLANLPGVKGYFIDVRMNSLFGGSGMFDDKVLYRGMLYVQRKEGEAPVSNVAFSQPELKTLSDAVKEYDFIEMVGDDCYNIQTGEVSKAYMIRQERVADLKLIKNILLKCINGSCGNRHFKFGSKMNISTVKLSDYIYCNLKCSHGPITLCGRVDILTLFNALGLTKRDIKIGMGVTQEIKPETKVTRRFLDRVAADDIMVKYIYDCVNEQTFEVEEIETSYTEVLENTSIDEEDIKCFKSNSLAGPMLLYKKDIYWYELDRYTYNFDDKDKNADEAIEEIRQKAPFLLPVIEYEDREFVIRNLLEACRRLCSSCPYGLNDSYGEYPKSKRKLNILIEQFFDNKIKHVRSAMIDQPKLWRDLKKFLVSKGVPEKDVVQFIGSFSFIFKGVDKYNIDD